MRSLARVSTQSTPRRSSWLTSGTHMTARMFRSIIERLGSKGPASSIFSQTDLPPASTVSTTLVEKAAFLGRSWPFAPRATRSTACSPGRA
jgi:hypothetical protein